MLIKDSNFVCVVISQNKILRQSSDSSNTNLILPFNKDYSIRLKNLHSRRALVKVQIDGKNMTAGGIIINPKETHDLLGEILEGNQISNKFKFVKKTNQLVQKIGQSIDDGIIKISVRFEKQPVRQERRIVKDFYQPTPNPLFQPFFGIGSPSFEYPVTVKSYNSVKTAIDTTTAQNYSTSFVNITDGKTVAGSANYVGYNTGYIYDLEQHENVFTMIMKGYDEQKKQVKDSLNTTDKVECSCGKKWESSMKFCGQCGAKIVEKKKKEQYKYPDRLERDRGTGRTTRMVQQAFKCLSNGYNVAIISHSSQSSKACSNYLKTSQILKQCKKAFFQTSDLAISEKGKGHTLRFKSVYETDVVIDENLNFSIRGFDGLIFVDPSVFECDKKYRNIIRGYNMFSK